MITLIYLDDVNIPIYTISICNFMIYGYSIYEASGDLKTYIIICTYGLNESNIVCNDSYSVSVVQIYSGLENCIPWTC